MPDLEEQIAEWRTRMAAGGIKTPAVLDELEAHLREEIRARITAGAAGDQAFREAIVRMGNADSLRDEFSKVDSGGRFLTGSFLLWLGLAGIVAIFVGRGLLDGRFGLLLATHIFSLTAGYLAALLAGGVAAAYVCAQWAGGTSSALRHRLASGSTRFIDLAVALVIVGFVLGILWSGQHSGRYWTKNVREIGALTALTCIIGLSAAWRIRRLTEEMRAMVGLGGSLVVGLAWFGTPLIAHNQMLFSWWPLDVFIGFHLVFISLGFARRQKPVMS